MVSSKVHPALGSFRRPSNSILTVSNMIVGTRRCLVEFMALPMPGPPLFFPVVHAVSGVPVPLGVPLLACIRQHGYFLVRHGNGVVLVSEE